LVFETDNTIRLQSLNSASEAFTSSAVYRDPSAWYHIVLTMNAAATVVNCYVNGVEITYASRTNPTNTNTVINASGNYHRMGLFRTAEPRCFDGYMAEVNFIDGQALTPSSFGAYDSNGVWQPITYTGTYGANGFYLNFSDTTSTTTLGYDTSGNSNNWTTNNISLTSGVTYDSMIDSPTNFDNGGTGVGNYCTFNPLAVTPVAATFAEANLKVTTATTGGNAFGTIQIPTTGKWYWEITAGSGTSPYIGIAAYLATQSYAWSNTNSVFYVGSNGNKSVDGTASAYGSTYTTNDVIGVAVDVGASTITFYKNNVSQGAISHTFVDVYPALADGASATTDIFYANFGQRPFSYTPPTDHKALNTQNLALAAPPTITNGAKYMAASTYTGTGATLSITNSSNNTIGTTFQPDFVWVKGRSGATDHALYDSVRGTTKDLVSNSTAAETTQATGLTAFNSNGFTVGALAKMNTNTATYVGWQWKASGTTSSNTNGSITSTVSVGTTQGFSVVTYTGTGANATVGHGLGVAPSMIINKDRVNGSVGWDVYHSSMNASPATGRLQLNTTAAFTVDSTVWNNTAPTSSVFSIGTGSSANINGNSHVVYCFAAVAGYSAFGSYTGNGSADGPFIYCGFRPRFVMMKASSAAGDWIMLDTSRDLENVMDARLQANAADAESTTTFIDSVSNGFKVRSTNANINASSVTVLYAAFAENPFTISRAR